MLICGCVCVLCVNFPVLVLIFPWLSDKQSLDTCAVEQIHAPFRVKTAS